MLTKSIKNVLVEVVQSLRYRRERGREGERERGREGERERGREGERERGREGERERRAREARKLGEGR